MSDYLAWKERSVKFLTKMAKNPEVQPIWHKFDVDDDTGKQRLKAEIERALFADEQILDEQYEQLIYRIAEMCIHLSEHELTADIAIIYVCVRVKMPTVATSEHIAPIFRVRNCSEDPAACAIIDHSGNFYNDFRNYLENNTWYQSYLMIPWQGQYRLDNSNKCSVSIFDQMSRVALNKDLNNFIQPTFPLHMNDIVNSITQIIQAQENQIINYVHKLHREHGEKFNALRQGYHEAVHPGEVRKMRGDEKFIKCMNSVGDINRYFDNLSLTSDGQFRINNELTLHPRALAQVPVKACEGIIETTKQLEEQIISLKVCIERIEEIRKGYSLKLVLDRERSDCVKYLTHKFEVKSLTDVRVGGEQIFANLTSTNIDRLHQVTKKSLNGDINYVRLGVDFSTKAGAKDSTEFCAATEYICRKVQAEINVRKRITTEPEGRGNTKLKHFYRDKIIEEFRAEDFRSVVESFQELRDRCDTAIKNFNPRFKNSFAAANHYDKHMNKILQQVDPGNSLSPKDYFKIASEMTRAHYSEVYWTQDGSSLCCTYLSEKYGTKAIKYVSIPDKISIVATLLCNDKKTKLCPSKYHYHPDY